MAKCDEGYPCRVCGKDVGDLRDSELYLRYVVGELDPETLHTTPECHLRCNPVLSQYIVHPDFPPVQVTGDFDKRDLDSAFKTAREQLVTRGWLRLLELARLPDTSLLDYPLPEVREALRRRADFF
jgi:hypothetical protein